MEKGQNRLASIPTIALQTLFDLQMNVLCTTVFLVNTIDGSPVISFRIFSCKSFPASSKGETFYQSIYEDRYLLNWLVYNQALTYQFFLS